MTRDCLFFSTFQIAMSSLHYKAVRKIMILRKDHAQPPPSLLRPTQELFGGEQIRRNHYRPLVHQHFWYAKWFIIILPSPHFIAVIPCLRLIAKTQRDFSVISPVLLQPSPWLLEMAFAAKRARAPLPGQLRVDGAPGSAQQSPGFGQS